MTRAVALFAALFVFAVALAPTRVLASDFGPVGGVAGGGGIVGNPGINGGTDPFPPPPTIGTGSGGGSSQPGTSVDPNISTAPGGGSAQPTPGGFLHIRAYLQQIAAKSCVDGVGLPRQNGEQATGVDGVLNNLASPQSMAGINSPYPLASFGYKVGSYIVMALMGFSLALWARKHFREGGGDIVKTLFDVELKFFGLAVLILGMQFAAGEGVFASNQAPAIVKLSEFASSIAAHASDFIGVARDPGKPRGFAINSPGDAFAVSTCLSQKIALIPTLSGLAEAERQSEGRPGYDIIGKASDYISGAAATPGAAIINSINWLLTLLIGLVLAFQIFLVKWGAIVIGGVGILFLAFESVDRLKPLADGYWKYVQGNVIGLFTITLTTVFITALVDQGMKAIVDEMVQPIINHTAVYAPVAGVPFDLSATVGVASTSLGALGRTFFLLGFALSLAIGIPALAASFTSGGPGLAAGNLIAGFGIAGGLAAGTIGAMASIAKTSSGILSAIKEFGNSASKTNSIGEGAAKSANQLTRGSAIEEPGSTMQSAPSSNVEAPQRSNSASELGDSNSSKNSEGQRAPRGSSADSFSSTLDDANAAFMDAAEEAQHDSPVGDAGSRAESEIEAMAAVSEAAIEAAAAGDSGAPPRPVKGKARRPKSVGNRRPASPIGNTQDGSSAGAPIAAGVPDRFANQESNTRPLTEAGVGRAASNLETPASTLRAAATAAQDAGTRLSAAASDLGIAPVAALNAPLEAVAQTSAALAQSVQSASTASDGVATAMPDQAKRQALERRAIRDGARAIGKGAKTLAAASSALPQTPEVAKHAAAAGQALGAASAQIASGGISPQAAQQLGSASASMAALSVAAKNGGAPAATVAALANAAVGLQSEYMVADQVAASLSSGNTPSADAGSARLGMGAGSNASLTDQGSSPTNSPPSQPASTSASSPPDIAQFEKVMERSFGIVAQSNAELVAGLAEHTRMLKSSGDERSAGPPPLAKRASFYDRINRAKQIAATVLPDHHHSGPGLAPHNH